MRQPWTPAQLTQVERKIRTCTTIETAVRAAQSVRPGATRNAIDVALRRAGKPTLAEHLAPAPTDIEAAAERSVRRATDADVRELQRQLVTYKQAAEFYTRIKTPSTITAARSRPKTGKRVATPCSIVSDLHVGEVVTEEETLGRNFYNLAEAARRIDNMWDNILWLRADAKRTQTCDDHVLFLNGDLVSGSIHPELRETNEVGQVEQVEYAIKMLVPGIKALAATCRTLHVECVHGNHGRWVEGKSPVKTGWAVSLESLLYRHLRDHRALADLPIKWEIPRAEGLAIDVHGYRIQAQHGTQIKGQGGIGGILVPLTRWAVRAATAHYYVFGHFHTACQFESIIVNGSTIGDSGYSKWHGMTFRQPEQVGFMIDEKRGLRRFDPISVS